MLPSEMDTKDIIAVGVLLGFTCVTIMLIAGRFLWGHKPAKDSNAIQHQYPVDTEDEGSQLDTVDKSWIQAFLSKRDRGRWVPTVSAIIEAGDEWIYSSALFNGLQAYPGELTLETVYEAFAHQLRSRPMTERSAYVPAISKFISTTRDSIERTQSTRVNRQSRPDVSTRRRSVDLLERGLNRSKSRKTSPILVNTFNPLSSVGATTTAHTSQSSWTRHLRHAQDVEGRVGINITSRELSALSVILGVSPARGQDGEVVLPFDRVGAFGISISQEITAKGKRRISLRQHKRSVAQLPARGSGHSILFAKHVASGSLPFSQDGDNVNSILITNEILEPLRSGENLQLQLPATHTQSSKFLSTLQSSRHITLHTLISPRSPTPAPTLLHAIATMPFVGGLVPLATSPLIETVRFVTSAGLPPARLLQRLEALVDKVHRQAPHLLLFGPLFEPHNAGLLFRERERLGKLATGGAAEDSIADKMARMRRYVTLVERLMAIIPGVKHGDVLGEVQEATKREIEQSYEEAVTAFKLAGTHPAPSSISSIIAPIVISKRHSNPLPHKHPIKRFSTSSIPEPNLTQSQSLPESRNVKSPRQSSTFPAANLGRQVEGLLKAELPFDVRSVAFVVRMVLVAWTLSVESVDGVWEEGAWGGEAEMVMW